MEDEIFTIYDKDNHPIDSAKREVAHQKGLWHSVVHVWVYDDNYVYFQQRSLQKKDYAGLFDITTAGHVDANEKVVEAALRECYEEIGIHLDKDQLQFLGNTKEAVFLENFIDKEIAHVFIYRCEQPLFVIGCEVEGMYKAYRKDIELFAHDKRRGLRIYDLQNQFYQHVSASLVCSHGSPYYLWILKHMDR